MEAMAELCRFGCGYRGGLHTCPNEPRAEAGVGPKLARARAEAAEARVQAESARKEGRLAGLREAAEIVSRADDRSPKNVLARMIRDRAEGRQS
jgi:hypothetical protein